MMEGIEVLSIGSIGVNQVFNWNVAIIGGIFLGIFFGILIGLTTDNVIRGLVTFLLVGAFFWFLTWY